MRYNFSFLDVTSALPQLLNALDGAPVVGSRAGRTKELTHVGVSLEEPWRREVLVPGRRCNIAAQIAETMWVLAGRDDVEWLARYLPRAVDYSDNGKTWRGAYGKRLRDWMGRDQLRHVVTTLMLDHETRQAVAVLYDPAIDHQPGKDIPCNNWLSFLIRDGALDLHVAVRSNDAMWGWSGINTFEWSALQEIVAGLVGVGVGQLHFSTTSFHIYEKHWERAGKIVRECQMTQRVDVQDSPRFQPWHGITVDSFDQMVRKWFKIEEIIRMGGTAWSDIDNFPEPMFRSWLRVLDWWWNEGDLTQLKDTALGAACAMGLLPAWKKSEFEQRHDAIDALQGSLLSGAAAEKVLFAAAGAQPMSAFLDHAIRTHNEKHEAYGDSWKRRGEMLGIMANIARKIDRLGGSETSDETSADTAMDLMVYLAKYRVWLGADDVDNWPVDPTATPGAANDLLIKTEHYWGDDRYPSQTATSYIERKLQDDFELLERKVNAGDVDRHKLVEQMMQNAYLLARILYDAQPHPGDEYLGADHE